MQGSKEFIKVLLNYLTTYMILLFFVPCSYEIIPSSKNRKLREKKLHRALDILDMPETSLDRALGVETINNGLYWGGPLSPLDCISIIKYVYLETGNSNNYCPAFDSNTINKLFSTKKYDTSYCFNRPSFP